jgi:hypothetical protein
MKVRIAVVIDTSFLMLDRQVRAEMPVWSTGFVFSGEGEPWWGTGFDETVAAASRRCLGRKTVENTAQRYFFERVAREVFYELADKVELAVYVPKEVTEELKSHFANESKTAAAKSARKLFAEIVDRGCEEPSLADVVPEIIDGVMGSDSPTDRKLVAFAKSLAASGKFEAVIVATDDGGILTDVVRLKREGAAVECLTKERIRTVRSLWKGILIRSVTEDDVLGSEPFQRMIGRPKRSRLRGLLSRIARVCGLTS